MPRNYTTTIKKTVKFNVPTAYDAAGHVADGHHEEQDEDVTVEFNVAPPDRSVGIIGYYIDDYHAYWVDNVVGMKHDVELDDDDLNKIIEEWEDTRGDEG